MIGSGRGVATDPTSLTLFHDPNQSVRMYWKRPRVTETRPIIVLPNAAPNAIISTHRPNLVPRPKAPLLLTVKKNYISDDTTPKTMRMVDAVQRKHGRLSLESGTGA